MRRPVESDFNVEVSEDTIAVSILRTRSVYTFRRFTTEREIAEFGPPSPDPVIRHGSRGNGARNFNAAEVQAM
jgi:hypothetical protein